MVDSNLRVKGYEDVFAVGDARRLAEGAPCRAPAQVAFQQADYVAWNVWAAVAERPLPPFKYQHIGDMMTTGRRRRGGGVAGGLSRHRRRRRRARRSGARRALYRMPTDAHRARLAGAWLTQMGEAVAEKGAAGALEEYLGLEVPEELKTLEKMLP